MSRKRGREMKILCDVCGADEAAVFCFADEAALCCSCDVRIHRANKLAGKHPRFSLISSSTQPHPLCDICQERRGLVFCKEERAIFCHDCDSPIHASNGLTMKHSRFILTGIRLSSASITTSSPSSEEIMSKKKASQPFSMPMAECGSSSNISEYLIKTLPGYRVEDFLLEDSVGGDVFHQSDALAPLAETDLDTGNFREASLYPISPVTSLTSAAIAGSSVVDVVEESSSRETSGKQSLLASPAAAAVISHGGEAGTSEEVFAVPQLPCAPRSNKRHCRLWAWDF